MVLPPSPTKHRKAQMQGSKSKRRLKKKVTGQLSAIAVISQILGCLAWLFTMAQAVGNNLVAAGFALTLVLNVVLGVQLWMYWGQGKVSFSSSKQKEEYGYELNKKVGGSTMTLWDTQPQIHQPIMTCSYATAAALSPVPDANVLASPSTQSSSSVAHLVSTPPPCTPSSVAGRKWAQKVD